MNPLCFRLIALALILVASGCSPEKSIQIEVFVRSEGGETFRLSAAPVKVVDENELVEGLKPIVACLNQDEGIPKSLYDEFFQGLRSHRVNTDAEGRVDVKVVGNRPFIVVRDSRLVSNTREEYLWVVSANDAKEGKLLLGNHNLGGKRAFDVVLKESEMGRSWNLKAKVSEQIFGARLASKQLTSSEEPMVRVSPKLDWLVASSRELGRQMWQLPSGREVEMPKKSERYSDVIEFSPKGDFIACFQSLAESMQLCRFPSFEKIYSLPPGDLTEIKFSQNGMMLLANISYGEKLILVDARSGKEIQHIKHGNEPYRFPDMEFSPDGQQFSVTCLNVNKTDIRFTTDVWSVTNATKTWFVETRSKPVFSPDSRMMAAVNLDGKLQMWDAATGSETKTFSDNIPGAVTVLRFSVDGKCIVANSTDGYLNTNRRMIAVWDTSTGQLKDHTSKLNQVNPSKLAISPNGRFAICEDIHLANGVFIWDLSSGRTIQSIKLPQFMDSMTFSPDGHFCVFITSSVRHSDSKTYFVEYWQMPTVWWSKDYKLND